MKGNSENRPNARIAVIGAGISGLAAAHRLLECDPTLEVTVLEAGQRPGGVLQTEQQDGHCMELGPDSMLSELPWGIDLCRRIGFANNLIGTNETRRQTYIVRNGRLLRLPEGLAIMAPSRIWPAIRSPILSVPGKLRLACEDLIRRRRDFGDESLASFAKRRFGRETFERLVQPLVSGIYMADPEQLSMRAALPRFVQMETQHGSLIRAAKRLMAAKRQQQTGDKTSDPRYSMFVAPRDGLGSLITALVDRLPQGTVRPGMLVERISRRSNGRWHLSMAGRDNSDVDAHEFDYVIIATPSTQASRFFIDIDSSLAEDLAGISHSGCIVVNTAYSHDQFARPLDGFGFVVPQVEQRDIIACTFSSVKYPHRAPDGHALLRVFLGGACRPDVMELDDDSLLRIVSRELNDLLGIRGEPRFSRITRWPNVMPQYQVGHLDRVDRIDAAIANLAGLELAGNSYRGVGIPHCIHSGESAADRIFSTLSGPRTNADSARVAR